MEEMVMEKGKEKQKKERIEMMKSWMKKETGIE